MKVFEAVAETLVAHDVTDVFGLMGDGNLRLIPHLTSQLGVRVIGTRHESAAIAMADGYARMSGRVGICTVTQGPGVTNALTALISARKARTPLVLLAGNTPNAVPGLPQDCDQDALFAAAGVPVQSFGATTAAADVAAAIELALTRPGPVAISMPTDVQDEQYSGPSVAEVLGDRGWTATSPEPDQVPGTPMPRVGNLTSSRGTSPPRGEPDPGGGHADSRALDLAVELLRSAQRPVVLAGRGAIRSRAKQQAVALADRIGALLATSLPGKSWFDDHPWSVGICGGLATPLGAELIADADVVVVLGASVNSFTNKAGHLFRPPTQLIHVDIDPEAIGAYTPAEVGLVGDAATTAAALLDRLPATTTGYRTPEIRRRLDTFDLATAHEDASGPDGLDPRTVCARLDALLPRRRSVVTDGGHFCGFPAGYLSVPRPDAFAFALDFGAVGLGLGTAMGAAVGSPDRLMVLAIGDGGLMMSLGDLDTAVRARIPMLILVFDDRAYGAEMHFLRMLDLPDEQSLFASVDLAGVAARLGAQAVLVDSIDALDDLAARAADLTGPLLAHIPVNRNVRAEWLEEAFARVLEG
ncbi:thiamine pyrophosphate-binding protein [Euzebya tangerina]|uniref:thiamine pyrophosphate-binding protein n=1 Tax=Euzebya tangerina TaxID=591198 RepID=UPI000E30EF67|nr:thiamine pyrophosphate-binding protein [Euzebya tangerina]